MPTPYFNLPLYTSSDTAALDTLLNGQASALDTALASAFMRLSGTDAQRIALAAPLRKEGLYWYSHDTNQEWVYDGTTWKRAPGSISFSLSAASPHSIPNASNTNLDFDDPGNLPTGVTWNDTTKVLTFGSSAVAGTYRAVLQGRWQTNGTGYREVKFAKNGAAILGGQTLQAITGTELQTSAACEVTLASGDTFGVIVVQNWGGALEFRSQVLSMQLLR